MAGQTYEICLIYLDDILVFSRTFLGTAGTFQLVVGDLFKIHKSTVCQTEHKLTQSKIQYISNARCSTKTRDECHLSAVWPVNGATDCTHIPIQLLVGPDAEIYRNRKGYFSVNVQLICDSRGCITDVVACWPGSVHDKHDI